MSFKTSTEVRALASIFSLDGRKKQLRELNRILPHFKSKVADLAKKLFQYLSNGRCVQGKDAEIFLKDIAKEAGDIDFRNFVEISDAYDNLLLESENEKSQAVISQVEQFLKGAASYPPSERIPRLNELLRSKHLHSQADQYCDNQAVFNKIITQTAEANNKQVFRLRGERGGLATYVNNMLGPRNGLEPGKSGVFGGGPGSCKTSFAGILACDALHAGIPTYFIQLELSAQETLEHILAAEIPEGSTSPQNIPFRDRHPKSLPDSYKNLHIPKSPIYNYQAIARMMEEVATENPHHDVSALFIVDYLQLITSEESRPGDQYHNVLARAASFLVTTAANTGCCLILLSQLTKDARRSGREQGTNFSGADIEQVAQVSFQIGKAVLDVKTGDPKFCDASNPLATYTDNEGELRMISPFKNRGVVDMSKNVKSTLWIKNRWMYIPTTSGKSLPRFIKR